MNCPKCNYEAAKIQTVPAGGKVYGYPKTCGCGCGRPAGTQLIGIAVKPVVRIICECCEIVSIAQKELENA